MTISEWLPYGPCQQMAAAEQKGTHSTLVDAGHLPLRDDTRDGQLSSSISIPFPRGIMSLGC